MQPGNYELNKLCWTNPFYFVHKAERLHRSGFVLERRHGAIKCNPASTGYPRIHRAVLYRHRPSRHVSALPHHNQHLQHSWSAVFSGIASWSYNTCVCWRGLWCNRMWTCPIIYYSITSLLVNRQRSAIGIIVLYSFIKFWTLEYWRLELNITIKFSISGNANLIFFIGSLDLRYQPSYLRLILYGSECSKCHLA